MFPSNQYFGFNTNNLELYPRRRPTEFYFGSQPPEEYQSRQSEHPRDKLQHQNIPGQFNVKTTRITPPKNSDMRIFRNSYFS